MGTHINCFESADGAEILQSKLAIVIEMKDADR